MPGETLRSIAQRWYGDPNTSTLILEANRLVLSNPNLLTPGQQLRIPQ